MRNKYLLLLLGLVASVSMASSSITLGKKEALLLPGGMEIRGPSEISLEAISSLALGKKEALLLPEGLEIRGPSEISLETNKDTVILAPPWEGPYYLCWGADYRIEYEATRLTPAHPCLVLAIFHGVASPTAGASKQCSVFVWTDTSGNPGSRLFQAQVTAVADSAYMIQMNGYPLTPPVEISAPFWVGNYEMDTLFPSSALDSAMDFPNKYSTDGVSWDDDAAEYFHAAMVEYIGGVEDVGGVIPREIVLLQNSPNPITTSITIRYAVPKRVTINLSIYDIVGRLTKSLANGVVTPGYKTVTWDERDNNGALVPSGVYFLRLSSSGMTCMRKLVILR